MDGEPRNNYRKWCLELPLGYRAEFETCLGRICSWHVPPNWGAEDWFQEICAVAASAAFEAESRFDPTYDVALDAYVHSRVFSRALARYRQEWAFATRCICDDVEQQDENTQRRNEAFLPRVLEGNPACDALLDAMTDLPIQSRWLIQELFWADRKEAEIGRELGITQQAVAKRKRAAMQWLSERLKTAKQNLSDAVVKRDGRCNH
jgi:RNA polymerase sigma factor (sigma-70 family)